MSEQHLRHVLADAGKAGVYHLPHIEKKLLVEAAKANGFVCKRVDLGKAADKAQLLAAVAKALKFPGSFGHNLDALADCLADMEWLPGEGYVILLEHCDSVQGLAEADFRAVLEVFGHAADEWRDEGVPFWCLVEMQANGISWLPTES